MGEEQPSAIQGNHKEKHNKINHNNSNMTIENGNQPRITCSLHHPEVWSNILSHLPPDELLQASEVLLSRLQKDEGSNHHQRFVQEQEQQVQEDASKLALENMMHVSIQYFRDHHTRHLQHGEDWPTLPGFPSVVQVEEFLNDIKGATTDPTKESQDLECRRLCHRIRRGHNNNNDQRCGSSSWWQIYRDLHAVNGCLLVMIGIGSYQRETLLAHAVHSVYLMTQEEYDNDNNGDDNNNDDKDNDGEQR